MTTRKPVEKAPSASVARRRSPATAGGVWEQSQAALYKALGAQLRTLWASNGVPHAAPTPQAVPAKPVAPTSAKAQEHHCEAHGKPFQRHEKSGKVWYSHKAPDGSWCNEEPRKAAA